MISTVHSSTFHSNHSGLLSSTFNAPAYGNSQAIYTHAGSSFQAPASNPSSGAFQPFNEHVYAPAPYYVSNHGTNAPFAGRYSSYTPGCSYLKYDSMFLPRPEFPKYSGDPLEFKAFMNNFETHIEPRIYDQKALFCLLVQHCVDAVKKRIQHFAGKGDQSYRLAKERLQKEYGSPWVVANECEQRLKKFPFIKSGNAKELKRFAELLESSLVTLGDIGHYGSLDSLDSLTSLVNKLPYELRRRWVVKSVAIENSTNSLAKFADLVQFVQVMSDEANSLFGLRSLTTKPVAGAANKPTSKVKASTFNVSSAGSITKKADQPSKLKVGVCWYCTESSHKLAECKKFLSITVKERYNFVKSNKLCHKCLSSKHRTPDCTKSDVCEVKGCSGKFHHTILHYSNEENKRKPSSSQDTDSSQSKPNSTNTTSCTVIDKSVGSGVYLCVVPVTVHCDGKEFATYAFLDQGSTHTFCDQSLVNFFGISGSCENLSIQTLNGVSRNLSTASCTLSVSDFNQHVNFTLPKVYVVDKIPVKSNVVSNQLLDMNYLKGVELNTIPGASVSLLIGADVPELFCIKSFRKGPHGTPVAIETPIGWSLLGPSLSPSYKTNCQVNFVRKFDDDVEQLVSNLWDADF